MLIFVVFDLASRSLSLYGWLLNLKVARVEVNISLAFFTLVQQKTSSSGISYTYCLHWIVK